MAINAALMAKQREARLARDAQRSRRIDELRTQRQVTPLLPVTDQQYNFNQPEFWDNIDTSGGADACHPWLGATNWNHPEGQERFQQGTFRVAGVETRISTRLLILLTYGKELPRTLDVTPLCGDHLCHNLRHLVITKHGGTLEKKLDTGQPVEEFFCAAVPT